MSAYTYVGATVSVGDLNVSAGRNVDGAVALTFTAGPSDLQLVVSAVGESSITFSVGPSALAGALSASGASTVTFTVTDATLGAIVDAVGTAGIQFALSATIKALGELAGDITPFTELSPQSLSAAVWNALTSQYAEAGSFGAAMAAAGSAGDPWATVLPGSYGAEQAGAVIYLIQQLLRNKVKTDTSTGTMTVYDDDGVNILFTAPIYSDANGAEPYDGTGGINLKDRLE